MKHYTETIPVTLAEKLKEKGMPIEIEGENIWCPSYAEIFDWFFNEEVFVNAYPERIAAAYGGYIYMYRPFVNGYIGKESDRTTWREAANAAIVEALELIKED